MPKNIFQILNSPVIFLILGLVLFTIGMSINVFYFNTLNEFDLEFFQNPFFNKIISFSPFLILLFPVLIAPIFEELAFRGWIQGSKKRQLLSIGLISFYTYEASNNIILTSTVSLLSFFIILKNKKNRIKIGIIYTSIIFGLLHINNYEIPMIQLGSISLIIGVGFILAYIAQKYTIIHSMAFHAVYNALIILPLLLSMNDATEKTFEGRTYQAELLPKSFFDNHSIAGYMVKDSMFISGNPANVAVRLALFKHDYIYIAKIDNLIQFDLHVKSKPHTILDREEVFYDYLRINKIETDTFSKPAYLLEINPELVKNQSNQTYKSTLFLLLSQLREKYDTPILLKEGQENIHLHLDLKTLSFKQFSEFKAYLEQQQGISISSTISEQINYVTFSIKD